MKTYICEICGDAYLGDTKPANCPFCGAPNKYIKEGEEANPIINRKTEIREASRKNLEEVYNLEVKASAIYTCMAGKAKTYEIKAIFKRLSKIELEHAVIATKLMGTSAPTINPENCSNEDTENFKRTLELEEHATNLYQKFAGEAMESNMKMFFTALSEAEADHINLIKNYL